MLFDPKYIRPHQKCKLVNINFLNYRSIRTIYADYDVPMTYRRLDSLEFFFFFFLLQHYRASIEVFGRNLSVSVESIFKDSDGELLISSDTDRSFQTRIEDGKKEL